MQDLTSEKDNQEQLEASAPADEQAPATSEAVNEEADDEEEETLSVEELEAEITRLRAKVSQLQAVLWKLGYDKEGKKIL